MEMTGKEVAIAILNGENPLDFEWRQKSWFESSGWLPVGTEWKVNDFRSDNDIFRRKPKARIVNGFTVPTPIEGCSTDVRTAFVASICAEDWCFAVTYKDTAMDKRLIERGVVFETKEAAVANAKAMCGINPNT